MDRAGAWTTRIPMGDESMSFKSKLGGAVAAVALLCGAQSAAADEITGAYFLE